MLAGPMNQSSDDNHRQKIFRQALLAAAVLLMSAGRPGHADEANPARTAAETSPPAPRSSGPITPQTWLAPDTAPVADRPHDGCLHDHSRAGLAQRRPVHFHSGPASPDEVFSGGAEFLLMRPHFSEAVAFAEGRQTPASFATEARELSFDYGGSFRVFAGYHPQDAEGTLRFTYWHFRGDTGETAVSNGTQFFVDPFGNVAGAVAVVDPSDARFGRIVAGGDRIHAKAVVESDIYDLQWIAPLSRKPLGWLLDWSAGVRIADIDQSYESVVTGGGALLGRGRFGVDFAGAGPRLGLHASRPFGHAGALAVLAETHGSLLVGDYDVRSGNTVTVPAVFSASQRESLTRTVPVWETELGLRWDVSDSLTLSGGWLFQAWFDLGTSGGQFGGFFTGADDANIMSFDGLFLRGELTF